MRVQHPLATEILTYLVILSPFTLIIYLGAELTALLVLLSMVMIGSVMRPRRLWTVWIASIIPVAIYVLIWQLRGEIPSGDPGQEETPLSVLLEWSFGFGPIIQLLPIWVGRTVRELYETHRPHRWGHEGG
jgi:hypothetical protein